MFRVLFPYEHELIGRFSSLHQCTFSVPPPYGKFFLLHPLFALTDFRQFIQIYVTLHGFHIFFFFLRYHFALTFTNLVTGVIFILMYAQDVTFPSLIKTFNKKLSSGHMKFKFNRIFWIRCLLSMIYSSTLCISSNLLHFAIVKYFCLAFQGIIDTLLMKKKLLEIILEKLHSTNV